MNNFNAYMNLEAYLRAEALLESLSSSDNHSAYIQQKLSHALGSDFDQDAFADVIREEIRQLQAEDLDAHTAFIEHIIDEFALDRMVEFRINNS